MDEEEHKVDRFVADEDDDEEEGRSAEHEENDDEDEDDEDENADTDTERHDCILSSQVSLKSPKRMACSHLPRTRRHSDTM